MSEDQVKNKFEDLDKKIKDMEAVIRQLKRKLRNMY